MFVKKDYGISMKIINCLNLDGFSFSKQVACLGFFDGLHIGHQALLKKVLKIAHKKNYQALFFTFSTSPKKMILNESPPQLLPLATKKKLIANLGFDNFVIFQFNEITRTWSINDFINYLKKLNIQIIVIGNDFRFSHLAKGNIKHLQANFSEVIVVPDVIKNQMRVSTTRIRFLLKTKKITLANKLLMQPYEITGVVVKGNQWGQKINFPTANIHLDADFNVLSEGIYLTFVWVDSQKYQAITCIITIQGVLKCESYLLNFDNDLYSKTIRVVFINYLRDNVPINNLEHLRELIKVDYQQALAYFKKIG